MINDSTSVDRSEFNIFLNNLYNKKADINNEIEMIKSKKDAIEKSIIETKKTIGKNPKALREYENTSESVLESIDLVYKNLNELKNDYMNIEEMTKSLLNQYESNTNNQNLENDLAQKLDNVKLLEEKIKLDNEKNYLIIDNFINNHFVFNYSVQDDGDFYKLTLENLKDNLVLKICEKRVELPYTKKEVLEFMKEYPDDYKTVQDVIVKEFMVNASLFNKHPILSRFKETYYLCRTKEMMSVFESFSYAKELMFKSNINPYIIAAVKSKKQLEEYIKCLEGNRLNDFPYFEILYEVNPLKV